MLHILLEKRYVLHSTRFTYSFDIRKASKFIFEIPRNGEVEMHVFYDAYDIMV